MTEYKSHILNEEDRVGFLNELGHDVVWDFMKYGSESSAEQKAEFDELFEHLGSGHHTNGSFYQGITYITLIRRKADGKLFGHDYWESYDDGRMYGEGFTSDDSLNKYDEENDWETLEEWHFFLPVELKPLPAYRFVEAEND